MSEGNTPSSSPGTGAGDGAHGDAAGGATEPGTVTQNGDGGQAPPHQPDGQSQTTGDDISSLPEWAQKLIRDTRSEAAGNRTKAKDAESRYASTLDAIAKALGVKDDKPTDPAKLAEELAAERDQGQQARTELAVFRAASRHGADPDKLLDSRKFTDRLKGVDPSDSTKISELIKKAVEENPSYRAAQAPPASGAPMGGKPPSSKPRSLEAAVAARYRKQ